MTNLPEYMVRVFLSRTLQSSSIICRLVCLFLRFESFVDNGLGDQMISLRHNVEHSLLVRR